MKEEDSIIKKRSYKNARGDVVCNGQASTLKVKRRYFAAFLIVCALLIAACLGMLSVIATRSYSLAEEYSVADGETNTDDTETDQTDETDGVDKTATDGEGDADQTAIKRIALTSDWQFVDKVPLLQDLPDGTSVTYAVHNLNGDIVQNKDITDDGKYYVTATLTGESAKNYYFLETGDETVTMYFHYNDEVTETDGLDLGGYSPLWAILIIAFALVGFIIALVKIMMNIHEHREDKKQQKQNESQKTCAFAGTALLAFLGLDVKVWMILAFIAVVLFFVGVIVMLITWKHHVVSHVANTATHIYVNNNYHYTPAIAAAAVVDDEEEEIVEEKRKRNPSNFRVRLKASSDKNKEFYVQLKNYIAGYRGVTFRMAGNTERVVYDGEMLAYIGTTKRSLKLWLALNPQDYDVEVYHHKDVSDKKRYENVPMLVKVGSGRALTRAEELIETILVKRGVEQKVRYTARNLQLLAYTLGRNGLVKDKRADMLRMSIHVHDASVLSAEDAEKYTEIRTREKIDKKNFVTINLDALDGKFLDGQRVTLDKLKRKELVPLEANGVRITAGTRLTKPLYVIADDFTQEAVKMIVLTGGRAIKLVEDKQENN